MTSLVLRLAAPIQTWGTYRTSAPGAVPTLPVPSKTGVTGLLGASLGLKADTDLDALADAFTLDVRVDRTNPFSSDLQVVTAIGRDDLGAVLRSETLRTATPVGKVARERTGGTKPGLYHRDFVPHAEFLLAITGAPTDVAAWHAAARQPAFMTYLGRRPNAPAFPFVLGLTTLAPADLFATAPRVARHDEPGIGPDGIGESIPVRCYRIDGDDSTLPAPHHVTPPAVDDRETYLDWYAENLTRD